MNKIKLKIKYSVIPLVSVLAILILPFSLSVSAAEDKLYTYSLPYYCSFFEFLPYKNTQLPSNDEYGSLGALTRHVYWGMNDYYDHTSYTQSTQTGSAIHPAWRDYTDKMYSVVPDTSDTWRSVLVDLRFTERFEDYYYMLSFEKRLDYVVEFSILFEGPEDAFLKSDMLVFLSEDSDTGVCYTTQCKASSVARLTEIGGGGYLYSLYFRKIMSGFDLDKLYRIYLLLPLNGSYHTFAFSIGDNCLNIRPYIESNEVDGADGDNIDNTEVNNNINNAVSEQKNATEEYSVDTAAVNDEFSRSDELFNNGNYIQATNQVRTWLTRFINENHSFYVFIMTSLCIALSVYVIGRGFN